MRYNMNRLRKRGQCAGMRCREQKRRSLMRHSAWFDTVNPSLPSLSGESPIIDSTLFDKDTTGLVPYPASIEFLITDECAKVRLPEKSTIFSNKVLWDPDTAVDSQGFEDKC